MVTAVVVRIVPVLPLYTAFVSYKRVRSVDPGVGMGVTGGVVPLSDTVGFGRLYILSYSINSKYDET